MVVIEHPRETGKLAGKKIKAVSEGLWERRNWLRDGKHKGAVNRCEILALSN